VRHLLDVLPGAVLPDPVAESAAPGAPIAPPDDDDLLRPAIEEELFHVGARGSLVGNQPATLAKHLVWTFGPVHRALPFPIQIRVELDGDRLVTVDPEVGFLHQGLEKAFEQVSWQRGFEIAARLHPLRPLGHELAWALAVERLCGVAERVPRRAQLWRTVGLELLRIAEHTQLLATPAIAPASRVARRALVDAARSAGGLLDGLTRAGPFAAFGGLAQPIHDDEADRIERELPRAIAPLRALKAALDDQPALDAHLEGLGRITRAQALAVGVTGPALRACDVADDVRAHESAFAYGELPFTPVVLEGADARARARVRLHEAIASADLVHAALGRLASAPPETRLDAADVVPRAGTAVASLEVPSGELVVVAVASAGDDDAARERPRRARMRGPSSALVAALPDFLVGDRIDDVVPVLIGLGLVGTEIDR